ncbi:hypothetical protein HAX54_011406, partial [Datura stramonium]|nr:hypothetical protein [Datura stramonium]
ANNIVVVQQEAPIYFYMAWYRHITCLSIGNPISHVKGGREFITIYMAICSDDPRECQGGSTDCLIGRQMLQNGQEVRQIDELSVLADQYQFPPNIPPIIGHGRGCELHGGKPGRGGGMHLVDELVFPTPAPIYD